MSVLKRLGLKKVINAAGYQTAWGGSLMPREVTDAILEASKQFMDLNEVLESAGNHIARATGNEAAFITGGAAAGIQTAAAACMTRGDVHEITRFPCVKSKEIIMHTSHRNPYDLVLRSVGARIRTIGLANLTTAWDLESYITPETVAVFYCLFSGEYKNRDASLSLEQTTEIAHSRGVPVILDAAGQIPPVSSLWDYTQLGVDLVIFSGGKGLRGPQSSGVIVGKRELVDWCRKVGFPNRTCLRGLKVTKEDTVGLVAAIDRALEIDEDRLVERYEGIVHDIVSSIDSLGLHHVEAFRLFPNQSGQPVPAAVVRFAPPDATEVVDRVIQGLSCGDPSIRVRKHGVDGLAVYPVTLHQDEGGIVSRRLAEVVSANVKPYDISAECSQSTQVEV